MYKTIEITEIIGSVYVEGYKIDSISISKFRAIMNRVSEIDQFISVRLSLQATNRALALANQNTVSGMSIIKLSKNSQIQNRFIREFYKLDFDTRSILSRIIREFIQDGKI